MVNSRLRAIVDERRFDRGSWTALGVVLVVIEAMITTTILSLARVGDGCLIDASNIDPGALMAYSRCRQTIWQAQGAA